MSIPLKRERGEQEMDSDRLLIKKQKITEYSVLDYLHEELVQHILLFVPQKRIAQFREVCKLFDGIIKSQEYWRRKSIEKWGSDDVLPEPRALLLAESSDETVLSKLGFLIPFTKGGLKVTIDWKQYYYARKKFTSCAKAVEETCGEDDSEELKGLSELKIESVDALSEYILEFDWDMIDIDLWEGGNSFQNVFARQMLDCITEIVLLYINNENWYLADYITDGLCAALQFSDYYVNHEALCVKWLTICEALPDKKASKIGSYYLLANQCFELLTKVTDFTKRVYERLIRTRIRLGTLTEHSPDRPTKHLHFRYPEKDMQVTPLGASFSGIDELVPVLLATVSRMYYDTGSDRRTRASALSCLKMISLTSDEDFAYSLFEFAFDAITNENEDLVHAGLVVLHEVASFCAPIDDRISDEQVACVFKTLTEQIRKQPVQHGLYLVDILPTLLVKKLVCVSDELLDGLNQAVLWLLQQPGVINSGSVECHSINRISDLGAVFKSRMNYCLPAYKEVLYKMALSPEIKADLITNEEILVVYYKVLNATESSEETILIGQVLANQVGFEVRPPQFFALCGNVASKTIAKSGDKERLALVIKAMLGVFSEQVGLFGQSSYQVDTTPKTEVPPEMPNNFQEFLLASTYINDSVAPDPSVLRDVLNFEVSPEPQIPDITSPYVVKINALSVIDDDFNYFDLKEELQTYFCSSAIEELTHIAICMESDFLPFAQKTLHIALAFARLISPPKREVLHGVAVLLDMLLNELNPFEAMQYVKILMTRLDTKSHAIQSIFQRSEYLNVLTHVLTTCSNYQFENPFVTSYTIKCTINYIFSISAIFDAKFLPMLKEVVRVFVANNPRAAYSALLGSNAPEWFAQNIVEGSALQGMALEIWAEMAIFFGVGYSLDVFGCTTNRLQSLKEFRTFCLKYYVQNGATVKEDTKTFLEILLIMTAASLYKQEAMEFGMFRAFNGESVGQALLEIALNDEIKKDYGTGSEELDRIIKEEISSKGFRLWYFEKGLRRFSKLSMAAAELIASTLPK